MPLLILTLCACSHLTLEEAAINSSERKEDDSDRQEEMERA